MKDFGKIIIENTIENSRFDFPFYKGITSLKDVKIKRA
ncbi:hypothetical protein J2795_000741 [Chryseobacterium bernardetii]|jgi:hypothetical protein|uniref:Uncharacterized protein n=1 Tax=Chryseobacterium bernardetii TaxID=1241978 RepID=A0ACC6IRB2_9FLAO|nr:hypothetical protein [Chryseobacterium vietnamense]MDR6440056.1 hypothetical protein [Chryseobacterium bernardetii]